LAGGAGAVAGPGRVPVLYGKAEVVERNAGELGKGFTIGKPGIFCSGPSAGFCDIGGYGVQPIPVFQS